MTDTNRNRYMTLLGDKPHASLCSAFFRAAHFDTAVLSSVFYGACAGLRHDSLATGVATLGVTLFFNIAGLALMRQRESLGLIDLSKMPFHCFPRKHLETKAIDTAPRGATTSPADFINAALSALSYKAALQSGLLTAGVIGVAGAILLSSPEFVVSQLASFGGYLHRNFSGMKRNQKIITGEWAIVDMPAKINETEKTGYRTPALTPTGT